MKLDFAEPTPRLERSDERTVVLRSRVLGLMLRAHTILCGLV